MNQETDLTLDLEAAGLPALDAARTAAAGLGRSIAALSDSLSGRLTKSSRAAAQSQKKLAEEIRRTARAARAQIDGFDELHLATRAPQAGKTSQTNIFNLPGDPGPLTRLAALLKEPAARVLPALGAAWQTVQPLLMQGLAALHTAFGRLGELVSGVFTGTALPMLHFAADLIGRLAQGALAAWQTVGEPILTGLSAALAGLRALLTDFYLGVVQPILTALWQGLTGLWQETLLPLWQQLLTALGQLAAVLLNVWNGAIQPFLTRLVGELGPAVENLALFFTQSFESLGQTVRSFGQGLVTVLSGLGEFLSGAFLGSWSRAWQGVRTVFGGVWQGITGLLRGGVNQIINLINALLRAVANGVNAAADAVNRLSLTVPGWVPGIGGRSFSPHLPHVPAYQLPALARGAVLPANRPFLAMVGDQRRGTNVEAPLETIKQALAETLSELKTGSLMIDAPIQVKLDSEVLYRAVSRIRADRGAQIGGAFAEYY